MVAAVGSSGAIRTAPNGRHRHERRGDDEADLGDGGEGEPLELLALDLAGATEAGDHAGDRCAGDEWDRDDAKELQSPGDLHGSAGQ